MALIKLFCLHRSKRQYCQTLFSFLIEISTRTSLVRRVTDVVRPVGRPVASTIQFICTINDTKSDVHVENIMLQKRTQPVFGGGMHR